MSFGQLAHQARPHVLVRVFQLNQLVSHFLVGMRLACKARSTAACRCSGSSTSSRNSGTVSG